MCQRFRMWAGAVMIWGVFHSIYGSGHYSPAVPRYHHYRGPLLLSPILAPGLFYGPFWSPRWYSTDQGSPPGDGSLAEPPGNRGEPPRPEEKQADSRAATPRRSPERSGLSVSATRSFATRSIPMRWIAIARQ